MICPLFRERMIGGQAGGLPGPFRRRARAACGCSCGRFLVRLEARFFVPTRAATKASRAGAVKAAPLARPPGLGLDGSEHGAMLGAVGSSTITTPPAV